MQKYTSRPSAKLFHNISSYTGDGERTFDLEIQQIPCHRGVHESINITDPVLCCRKRVSSTQMVVAHVLYITQKSLQSSLQKVGPVEKLQLEIEI